MILLKQAWTSGLNAPQTSAAGRLFDAAAHMLGLLDQASYEGQGGMYLEQISAGEVDSIALPLHEDASGLLTADWQLLVAGDAAKRCASGVEGDAVSP